ncbi:MAG: hypothetical protein ACTSVI_12660 [Promethearchaeota archaeon]
MTYDFLFKNLLKDLADKAKINSDVNVGKLPLKIDVVLKYENKPIFKRPIPILESRMTSINIIEYKSSHDVPKKQDITKFIGYIGLFANSYSMGLIELINTTTAWYISANRPKFLTNLENLNLVSKEENVQGLYKINASFPCNLFMIIINELEISDENKFLLLLASEKKFKDFLKMIISKKIKLDPISIRYLSLKYYFEYKEVHLMEGLNEILSPEIKENIRLAIESIGIAKAIDAVGLEKVIDAVGLEKVIDAVGLEKIIKLKGSKEIRKILEKIEKSEKK